MTVPDKNDTFNPEELRILRAAASNSLRTNKHGRWIIVEDAARPAPPERKRLLKEGFISWPHYVTGETLTARGRAALNVLPSQEATDAH